MPGLFGRSTATGGTTLKIPKIKAAAGIPVRGQMTVRAKYEGRLYRGHSPSITILRGQGR